MAKRVQLRLPLEAVEVYETTTYKFFYIDGVTIIESETEYHEPEQTEED